MGPGGDPPVRIQAAAPLIRDLSSGEVHLYHLTLDEGDYARLEVIQQGLDVATEVRGPSGSRIILVDTSSGRFSTENVSFIADRKGQYEVEVSTFYPGDTGKYKLIVAALHKAGADDRLRVEAEHADLEASRNLEAARRALANWRALGDRLHEGRALTRLGKAMDASGKMQEGLAWYEQALSIQRGLNDREGLAETLGQMGRTLSLAGDDRRALDALQESLTLWQELHRPDSAAAAYLNVGNVHQRVGDYGAAVSACERTLELSHQAGDRGLEAQALNCLGQMRFWMGQPLLGLEELRQALDLARSTGRSRIEAQVLSNLGSLHQRLGMPRDALEHYTAAREILRSLRDTEGEAVALGNLGMLLIQLGAFEEAREMLGQALPFQHDPRRQALTLVGLSHIAEELGQTGEAASRIEKALALQRAMKDSAGEAEALRAQGLLLLQMGKPEEAEAKLREALAIHEELGRRSDAAAARRGLARAYVVQRKFDAAREAYEQSRREAEDLGDVGSQILTTAEQGWLEREDGKLTAARQRLEAALDLMESFRSEVGGDRLRSLHFATVRETYERYVDVLMQLHRADPKAGLDAKAFEVAEQSRARGLLDILSRARVDIREGQPELLARELRLRQELNAKAALRLELAEDESSRARNQALQVEIDTLAAEHRVLEARLTDGSSYESLKKPSLPIREIQGLLGEQTVLMEYLLAEPRSYLWVVSSTSLQAFELPGRSEIGAVARRFHGYLKNPGNKDIASQRKDRDLLAQQVLGPALEAIRGRRLVIVADGALQYVPFAALPVHSATDGIMVPLVVEHEIGFLPSAAVLKEIRKAVASRPRRPTSIAVLADPAYDGTPILPRRVGGLATRGSGLERLSWTRQEAEGIAGVAQGREILLALGHDATRELVTSGRLEPFRALHFATHGILDSEHPELSMLALSQRDASGRPLNGFLSLQDLYSLRLQADLVVLSGCDTGLGRELRGEGLVGLTHGFLHAGASQVVASLWPVRDRAAAELMQRFYRAMLRDGQRPTAALRSAQIEIWKQRTWRDPYFWAPFVAQGDWDTSL
ncbi:MAG TPA: CHAT domain-containing tetratricopeptide repeat protein [Thermoanaerobaculia bacterium]|jgi:CHAT domain-containing protein/Tfp pilus assembly protein PilF|nr:CHAT domain-containing tetratricopeptide repeat protein [Thermoanaerobaculia bacterium]